jgi:hypothetical protein
MDTDRPSSEEEEEEEEEEDDDEWQWLSWVVRGVVFVFNSGEV